MKKRKLNKENKFIEWLDKHEDFGEALGHFIMFLAVICTFGLLVLLIYLTIMVSLWFIILVFVWIFFLIYLSTKLLNQMSGLL